MKNILLLAVGFALWSVAAIATYPPAIGPGGAITIPVRSVTLVSGPVTIVPATDYMICLKKVATEATTVNLPASPGVGWTYLIKDCKGDAATNNITITPASGTIDGAATYVINTNRGSVSVTYDGTQWEVS
jgi:hypothetical protein